MSITPPKGDSPISDKKISPLEISSPLKGEPKGLSSASSISSLPVTKLNFGSVKKLSLMDRFKLGQEIDQNLLPTFAFHCPTILLKDVEGFVKGKKTSLLVLGESVHQPLEQISGEYRPFYINLAKVKDPEEAINETLKRYGFDPDEIKQMQKNFKYLFVFYNCHNKADSVQPDLAYKNGIFKSWQGKLISFCAPFNLPGPASSFFSVFIPTDQARTQYPEFFIDHIVQGLSDGEIQDALNHNLSTEALHFVEQMKEMVPDFWELLRTRSMLQALLQILPPTFKEMSSKQFYDAWLHQWFAWREKETGIAGLEKKCREHLTKFAKAMVGAKLDEVEYVPDPFEEQKWDSFLCPEGDIDLILRNSPLDKNEEFHRFLPSLQYYFATGNVQTVSGEMVDIYYV